MKYKKKIYANKVGLMNYYTGDHNRKYEKLRKKKEEKKEKERKKNPSIIKIKPEKTEEEKKKEKRKKIKEEMEMLKEKRAKNEKYARRRKTKGYYIRSRVREHIIKWYYEPQYISLRELVTEYNGVVETIEKELREEGENVELDRIDIKKVDREKLLADLGLLNYGEDEYY